MREHSAAAQGWVKHGTTERGEKRGGGRGGRASLTVCVKREISLLTDPTRAVEKPRDGDKKNSWILPSFCLTKQLCFPVAKHKVIARRPRATKRKQHSLWKQNKMKFISNYCLLCVVWWEKKVRNLCRVQELIQFCETEGGRVRTRVLGGAGRWRLLPLSLCVKSYFYA